MCWSFCYGVSVSLLSLVRNPPLCHDHNRAYYIPPLASNSSWLIIVYLKAKVLFRLLNHTCSNISLANDVVYVIDINKGMRSDITTRIMSKLANFLELCIDTKLVYARAVWLKAALISEWLPFNNAHIAFFYHLSCDGLLNCLPRFSFAAREIIALLDRIIDERNGTS